MSEREKKILLGGRCGEYTVKTLHLNLEQLFPSVFNLWRSRFWFVFIINVCKVRHA